MTQLAEGLRLDLPYTLARDGEILADFFQGVLAAVADAEAHLDHLLLARRERLEDRLRLLLEVQIDDRLRRRDDVAVLDEIAQMRIFLFPDRGFERDRLLRDLQYLPDLRDGNIHPLRDFLGRRFAAELLHERTRGAN